MYSITFQLIFVRMKATHTVTGASREDCMAQVEAGFNASIADEYVILSEGPINV
jgi:hypothetical protein